MSPRRQSPLSLEFILLGLLNQTPVHGYDLYKKVSNFESISLVWHIKQSLLYALLEKLEGDRLLSSKLVPGEAHPMRKEYRITEMGKEAFYAWRLSPVSHGRDMRQEFLAKLYFAQQAGTEVALTLIEGQKSACLEWLTSAEVHFAALGNAQRYERFVFQFRISQNKAMLEWLVYCQQEIQNHPPVEKD